MSNKKIIQLTKNFSLNELVVSAEYPELADSDFDYILDDSYKKKLLKLHCQMIWQPIRDMFQREYVICLSGYRGCDLNRKIGGAETSDHVYGAGLDMTSTNLVKKFEYMYNHNFQYRQIILYPDQNFIHTSINHVDKPYKNEALVKYSNRKDYLHYNGGLIPSFDS